MGIEFRFPEPIKFDKINPIDQEIEPICPTCNGLLNDVPKRKTKCPHCGKFIFLKYSPSNPIKRLVTEIENEAIEKEWEIRQFKQSLIQKLSSFGITESDLDKLNTDYINKIDIFKNIIPLYIDKLGEFSKIGKLYFEIADELFPKAIEVKNSFNHLTEEEIDGLDGEEDYFPWGFIIDNYWESVLAYIRDFIRESNRIKKYCIADIKYYQFSAVINDNSSEWDKNQDGKTYLSTDGKDYLERILTVSSKEELQKIRPLLLFNEKSIIEFYFPPFHLGDNCMTIMSYRK